MNPRIPYTVQPIFLRIFITSMRQSVSETIILQNPKIQKAGRETGLAPYMKACPRFCYYGCGLFLPQKNEVQGDANQDAGEHSPSKLGKNNQQGRDTGQSEDYSQNSQYLAAINALIHVKHCYTSSSVRV